MSNVFEDLLKFKNDNNPSQEFTQDEIDNHPDSISEFENKRITDLDDVDLNTIPESKINGDDNSISSNISSISSNSISSNSISSNQSMNISEFDNFQVSTNSIDIVNDYLEIKDYFVSLDHYHTKLERPYLIVKKKSQFSSGSVRPTFCYRIITSCLSLHKIIDCIKPYFGFSEYGMLSTKIEHKNKLVRLGILSLSKSVFDAPTRLNSSMYVDMTSLPIEIIIEQYGIGILNCIRSIFAFREIIGFKTPNSGESLSKGAIFFDYRSADDDIEKGITNNPSKYILTFPETLTFVNRNNNRDEIYTKRVISKKYVKKFFKTEDNYATFLKNYVRTLNLDVLKECILKTIQDIDKSYEWLIHYIFKRIHHIK